MTASPAASSPPQSKPSILDLLVSGELGPLCRAPQVHGYSLEELADWMNDPVNQQRAENLRALQRLQSAFLADQYKPYIIGKLMEVITTGRFSPGSDSAGTQEPSEPAKAETIRKACADILRIRSTDSPPPSRRTSRGNDRGGNSGGGGGTSGGGGGGGNSGGGLTGGYGNGPLLWNGRIAHGPGPEWMEPENADEIRAIWDSRDIEDGPEWQEIDPALPPRTGGEAAGAAICATSEASTPPRFRKPQRISSRRSRNKAENGACETPRFARQEETCTRRVFINGQRSPLRSRSTHSSSPARRPRTRHSPIKASSSSPARISTRRLISSSACSTIPPPEP